ncbi:MAG TPA: acyltransferase domain-containing protein [Deltaproteobacteria bacterium]|nr:acyltransferase domain-containing protein [Deltaproteobacteria bacterium]
MQSPIAIVGVEFVFPGGIRTLDALQSTLESATPQVGPMPPGPRRESWPGSPEAAWVPDIEAFDPGPFQLSEAEATLLDPRHRLLLYLSRRALHATGALQESEGCGVFLGLGSSEYRELCPPGDPRVATGNEASTAAGRIAHSFDLGGPNLVVDTACSSSLVALQLACQALSSGDCTVALVGAAQLIGSAVGYERLVRTGIISEHSRCRPYDAAADGTIRGEGGAVLVLRPLEAAERRGDAILGIIRGIAVRHDGTAAGLTVPNGPAQERTVRAALASAGLQPDAIGLIEGHGTGTSLGDPIEVRALHEIFGDRPVPITSTKALFGHLESAAGLLGLIATLAALRAGRIPPVGNLQTPSPRLPSEGPRPNAALTPIEGTILAGVSSFGLSGTNAHVILEAGPGTPPEPPQLAWEPRPLWVDSDQGSASPPQEVVTDPGDVRAAIAAVLGGNPDNLPAKRSLFELGLDSVGAAELARRLEVPVSVIFEHPTLASLEARTPRSTRRARPVRIQRGGEDQIAIVAAACRFPGGADDLESYFELLCSDRDPITEAPPERGIDGFGGYLTDVFGFDAEAFGLSLREAEVMDPQQRLWLEVASEVVERAALHHAELASTGMFVGAAESQYLRDWRQPHVAVGNEGSFLAGRTAHTLDLGGPVMMLNTACSASLVAVHIGARALRDRECDAVIAGGVNLILSNAAQIMLTTLGVLSPTGRCHTYSEAADGYVRGEGAAAVLMMRHADAVASGRRVLGVIRGSAVAHDGRTGGVGVPGPATWRKVVVDALDRANLGGDDIGYIEVHGSATPLGDAIEVKTLGEALSAAGRTSPVWAGCAKSRIGHLEQAAGMAGLLKVLAMLKHGVRTPNLHFDEPSSRLPEGVVRVPTEVEPWDGPRIAGISSFGISGTASHVIVAAPPLEDDEPAAADEVIWVPLSARNEAVAAGLGQRLADAVVGGLPPRDAARTLAAREPGPIRAAIAAIPSELPEALRDPVFVRAGAPKIAWVFPGVGPQRLAMGADLEGIEAWLDEHEGVVEPILGPGLRAILLDQDERIRDVAWTVTATVALELCLAERLLSWGLRPAAVAGHSFGEITAAAVAGVVSTDDALRLAAMRGKRMRDVPDDGAMVVVRTDEATASASVGDAIDVAATNSPTETVLSGPRAALQAAVEELGVDVHWLKSERALHSRAMQPIVEPFVEDLRSLEMSAPELPLITCLDGARAGERAADPVHWGALLRNTVRFQQVLEGLAGLGCDTFLEIGPHPTLLGSVGTNLGLVSERLIPTLRRDQRPEGALLTAAARLWAVGAPIDPEARIQGGRISSDVPVAPLQREELRAEGIGRIEVKIPHYHHEWEPVEVLDGPRSGRWAVLGGGALAQELAAALSERGVTVLDAPEPGIDGLVFAPEIPPDAAGAMRACVIDAIEVIKGLDPGVRTVFAGRGTPGLLQGVARALSWERAGVCAVSFDAASPASTSGWERPEISWRQGTAHGPHYAQRPAPTPPSQIAGTWIVIGGFGALGKGLGLRLAARGASRVIAAGPRPRAVPEPLEPRELDARDPAGLAALIEELGDVQGIVLAAGVLDDAKVEHLDEAKALRVLEPKVLGVAALQAAAAGVPHWILMSSASGWVGSPGQVPYSSANAALDAAAQARRAEGLHACAVALGPVADAGMAARQGNQLRQHQELLGIRTLPLEAALDALEAALSEDAPALLGVFDVDWDRLPHQHGSVSRATHTVTKDLTQDGALQTAPQPPSGTPKTPTAPTDPQAVEEIITRTARRYLRKPIPDRSTDLVELGLDSLGAVGLRNALAEQGIVLPASLILRGPSLSELTASVLGHHSLEAKAEASGTPAPTPAMAVALTVLTLISAVALLMAQA